MPKGGTDYPLHIPTDVANRLVPGGVRSRARSVAGRPIQRGDGIERPTSVAVFPPQYMRPPQAVDFNQSSVNSGVAGPTTTVTPAGLEFQLPDATVAVIKSLSLNVNNMTPTAEILFSILFNGSPVPGWNNLRPFPRNAASVSVAWGPEELALPVPEGTEISMSIQVVDAGTYDVGADYHGWFYSVDIENRFSGAWE